MIRVQCREEITQEMVLSFFEYNSSTGEFFRLKYYDSYGKLRDCRRLITSSNNRGYFWCGAFGKQCLVHRLIWLYVTGNHPSEEIDHINGNRKDNRWVNLREVSPFENARNQGNRKDNTSHCRGVNYDNRKNHRGKPKWVARISHKGVRYLLGRFDTYDEAVDARKKAEKELNYHPNHAKRGSHRYG